MCKKSLSISFISAALLLSDLQHIEQDERVSTGLNGDLYFSHAVEKDSRRDYCCFAAFHRIRTIVQKTAMSVNVKTSRSPSHMPWRKLWFSISNNHKNPFRCHLVWFICMFLVVWVIFLSFHDSPTLSSMCVCIGVSSNFHVRRRWQVWEW